MSAAARFRQDSASEQATSAPRISDLDQVRGLALTPKAFRVATRRIEPALVAIESFGGVSTLAGRIGGIRKQGEGNTTGLMISADGYVVTSSFNFVEQPPVITMITSDGQRRVAKMLGRDDTRRICLLKIEGVSEMPAAEFVPTDQMRVGQWALSVGVGYGDKSPAISLGIVSALNRFSGRAIQTDANISPANYGGPLLDLEGRVLGICVPMAPGAELTSGVQWYDSGIGFAIPLAGKKSLLAQLKRGEHVERAFIGVTTENAGNRQGARIVTVVDDTGAKNAGLTPGDVITTIDNHEIRDIADLSRILESYVAGDEVTILFLRGEDKLEQLVKLGSPPRPDAMDTPSLIPGRRRVPEPDRPRGGRDPL